MTARLLAATAVLVVMLAGAAVADDHLATAFDRADPALGSSDPFCVPGTGSPNAGDPDVGPHRDVSCRRDGTSGTGRP